MFQTLGLLKYLKCFFLFFGSQKEHKPNASISTLNVI